jgi:hypothetical protein
MYATLNTANLLHQPNHNIKSINRKIKHNVKQHIRYARLFKRLFLLASADFKSPPARLATLQLFPY